MIRRPPRSTLFPTRRSSDLIGEDAAHWMAVLGMDQYAHALTARLPGAVLVEQQAEIAAARQAGRLPVLAPYRDRKSTRLNSSHSQISYAVFCLKKKTNYALYVTRAATRFVQSHDFARRPPVHVSAYLHCPPVEPLPQPSLRCRPYTPTDLVSMI